MHTRTSTPRLKRQLGLWGLLFYGIVVIQPTAPLGSYGAVSIAAQGHVATTLLLGMFAMVLTAISYGRMANTFPQAGSAYSFVGRVLHPNLGFLTGWSIALDYMLLPTIAAIWCAKAAMNLVPLPFAAYLIGFAILSTLVNLRGIQLTTKTNIAVTIGLVAVLGAFFVSAAAYVIRISGVEGLVSSKPFYDPQTFSWRLVSTGTSIAVLTYMGFDCVSTLSEDVQNPRRNVLLATILLCIITGILGTAQVYAGQLVWPDFRTYPDQDTAFVSIAGRAGGPIMFQVMNFALLVATIGTVLTAQLGSSRLLYAMGRDDAIPRSFFGYLDSRHNAPRYNLLLSGALIIIGGLMLTYQLGAELVNFGAFIAFMGVNLAALTHYYLRAKDRGGRSFLLNCVPPLLGFAVCFWIWASLRIEAKIAGFAWMGLGIAYCAWKTSFFRRSLILSDPESSE